ncbi:MAG: DUF2726 domain-containing protein [Patescibacteria group bacterium]
MNIYILIGSVVILVILMALITEKERRGKSDTSEDYKHFIKRSYLMTVPERKFYDILVSVVDAKYHVVPQMVLSNVVSVNKYEKHKATYRNKINRYVLDFVIFEKPYFTPHIVIELDDSSHLLPERESRDDKVNAILEGVGVRVVHIKTAHVYNRDFILTQLDLDTFKYTT